MLEFEAQTAMGGAEDPSRREKEMATHNKEEASSSETAGTKDEVEQATKRRNETHMQAVTA